MTEAHPGLGGSHATIKAIGEGVRQQAISPVAIVEACLERIEELNPKLNAFITVLAEEARERARSAEEEIRSGGWRGLLHGVPVGIKDFYDTAGIRTTAAFEHFRERVPARDALGVARLKQAGAIVIGKTNMHRLGMGTTGLDSDAGPVLNPWDHRYIPGGSSSGSAAAVATGMCYATLDTDAIGSCRLPAACCGVVGFKGTYGLIDPQGILDGEPPPDPTIAWLSHPGITARCVADTAVVLDVLAERERPGSGIDFLGELSKKRWLRVGVASNAQAGQEVATNFAQAVETIRGLGHAMNSAVAPLVEGNFDVRNIEADRRAIARQAFTEIDVLLLPTTATAVPLVEDAKADPLALSSHNTAFANYYGLPAISVPSGFDSRGLPLGLQIVARPWDEGTLLYLAHQVQEASPWAAKHPGA